MSDGEDGCHQATKLLRSTRNREAAERTGIGNPDEGELTSPSLTLVTHRARRLNQTRRLSTQSRYSVFKNAQRWPRCGVPSCSDT